MERNGLAMSVYHEVIEALLPLIQAFDQLGISYYIGGSVSSSLHGLPCRTQDVDVIVDIPLAQVHSLFQLLQSEYYLDEQALDDSVRHSFPYNVLHLKTMMKVDLIPLKRRAFTREEARRAQSQVLEMGTPPLTAFITTKKRSFWFCQNLSTALSPFCPLLNRPVHTLTPFLPFSDSFLPLYLS
jgi:hypothetical protein